MTERIRSIPLRLWLVAAVVAASTGTVIRGQAGSSVIDPNGGLKELTAEVRQLRLAVEESTRAQGQTQALGVYLTVEQGRVMQVVARMDTARKDREDAEVRMRVLARDLAAVQAVLSGPIEPEERRAIEVRLRETKQELEDATAREQQARTREAEISQSLQLEEGRWNDLIARLEQLIKR
jgi:chromosome segregation ATPase